MNSTRRERLPSIGMFEVNTDGGKGTEAHF